MVAEALLIMCQSFGSNLYNQCVKVPPVDDKQVAVCSGLKAAYNSCLSSLNAPYPLSLSLEPDPYGYTPFTPCEYDIAHLILKPICY